MNSNTFFNRVEILLYSIVISVMTGLNQLRAQFQHLTSIPIQHSPNGEAGPTELNDHSRGRSLFVSWETIQQALLSLLLWVILGFAAGFLIGMIKPW